MQMLSKEAILKKKVIALFIATIILTDSGVSAYAETPCASTITQEDSGSEVGYTAPELEETDFSFGIGQVKQLIIPQLPYSFADPVTGQIITEYIQPTVNYSVSDATVASVGNDGIVTGLAPGMTTVTIEYSYVKDDMYICGAIVDINVYVTDAMLSNDNYKINLRYGTNEYVTIEGMNDLSTVEVIPSSKYLQIQQEGHDFYFYPKKAGDYTVTFIVDGKSLFCNVSVLNLAYSYNSRSVTDVGQKHWNTGSTMVAMYTGEKTKLKAKGFPEGEKVVWTSTDKSVATVSKDGEVTAKSVGYTTISASAHGFTITYEVGVSYKTSIKAMRYAVKHYNSIYSQPKRMSKGYYDCSSYVWRAYKAAGMNIGNCKTGWAPVAASLAQWCVTNNYMVYSGTVKVDDLMPGDLIFWTGAKNGRYKGIYHVDMYVGNRHSLTVAREKCFGDTISNCMVARPNSGTKVSKIMASATKDNGKKAIKISWSSCHLATGYNVYRSTSANGKFKRIATVIDSRLYVDTNVKSGQKYYYKIRPYWRADSKTYHGKISEATKGRKI